MMHMASASLPKRPSGVFLKACVWKGMPFTIELVHKAYGALKSKLRSFYAVDHRKVQLNELTIARIVKALVFSVLSIRSLELQILSFILGIPIS
ncbi:hypothetical protein Tco_1314650 [Tanacetum coccineum]